MPVCLSLSVCVYNAWHCIPILSYKPSIAGILIRYSVCICVHHTKIAHESSIFMRDILIHLIVVKHKFALANILPRRWLQCFVCVCMADGCLHKTQLPSIYKTHCSLYSYEYNTRRRTATTLKYSLPHNTSTGFTKKIEREQTHHHANAYTRWQIFA